MYVILLDINRNHTDKILFLVFSLIPLSHPLLQSPISHPFIEEGEELLPKKGGAVTEI